MLFFSLLALAVSTVSAQSSSACGLVSERAVRSPTSRTVLIVDAEIAEECLRSVPIRRPDANRLLDSLQAWWSYQSTLAWLKDPPASYPVPGVDLLGGLNDVRNRVNDGTFAGEYEFELALQRLIYQVGDGHLNVAFDLLDVFTFTNRPVVAVSEDGRSSNVSYYFYDDIATPGSIGVSEGASPIETINGTPVQEYFASLTNSTFYADRDAQWNAIFRGTAAFAASTSQGTFGSGGAGIYFGANTSVTFVNGSDTSYTNRARFTNDFSAVTDGNSFYEEFCSQGTSPNCRRFQLSNARKQLKERQAPSRPRSEYPEAVLQDAAGSVAGYFLDGQYSDTAVVAINAFVSDGNAEILEAQDVLGRFLDACRTQRKQKIIIDLSSNPGGYVFLAFDFFKQFFPSIEPFNAQNARATVGFDVLGAEISPEDVNNFADADAYVALNGSRITWPQLFGPQSYKGDSFTNLFRRRYDDPATTDPIAVSGYGARSRTPPQPFQSQNIIIVTEGLCDSACTLFTTFMKQLGKVRQVGLGGLPQDGPMQVVGGTRGSLAQPLEELVPLISVVPSLNPTARARALGSELGVLLRDACYLLGRVFRPESVVVNFFNAFGAGDRDLTPLQMTYEAADCKLFWTLQSVNNITRVWTDVADALNTNFANCVAGSTGQPSSLSGNAALYNGGNPANVSADAFPPNVPGGPAGGDDDEGAATMPAVSMNVMGTLLLVSILYSLL